MAVEIYAFSDTRLDSLSQWQSEIDRKGFALKLSTAGALSELRGFFPVDLAGAPTGFECDHWNPRDIFETYPEIDFRHAWRFCLAFRFGELKEGLAASMAAAAYAAATNGVVFDEEDGQILSPERAVQQARDLQRDLPRWERELRVAVGKLASKHD